MKKTILLTLVSLLLSCNSIFGQDVPDWQPKTSALSVYFTGPLGFHTNVSYDYLKFNGKFFSGFTVGGTIMVLEGVTAGPHLTYSAMFGKGDHHFETRLGLAVPFDSYVTYLGIIPVVSIAYRYQKPEGKTYFRIGINTAVLGIGGGIIIN